MRGNFETHLAHLVGKPCTLLEIGSFEGRSACWLVENIATHRKSRLVCIDPWIQPVFRQNILASKGGKKVDLRVARSGDVLPTFEKGFFDFIYVDGSHATKDVVEDAIGSFRVVKKGGIIGFDDYKWDNPENCPGGVPGPAIDEFLAVYRYKIMILEKGYQVWIRKVTD